MCTLVNKGKGARKEDFYTMCCYGFQENIESIEHSKGFKTIVIWPLDPKKL
jgi:hypothetical protein